MALAEKGAHCECVVEKPWEPRPEYLELNPSGEVPTLVVQSDNRKSALADATAICEYIDETVEGRSLLGKDPVARAETRRLAQWFEQRMWSEAVALIVGEKAVKRLSGGGEPDSKLIRAGCQNLHPHLDYIGQLAGRRNWLAGDDLTLADLAAAAQLSVVDYIGDVPWDKHQDAKDWYVRIKSRPSFRSILGDHIPGLPPQRNYANLDF